uniref:Uncharacterized protein n=1 Tax=Tetradesmus obliquus TaxID=3088 RepID=A0A383WBH0_TETOB
MIVRQLRQLLGQNQALRQREQVLMEAVQEQGDNLHYVALAAFQQEEAAQLECCCDLQEGPCCCGAGDMAAITASLLGDLQVYQLMQLVGGSAAAAGAAEPNTTQWMRSAITPERVSDIRSASAEDIAGQLRELTMRLSHLLTLDPRKAALMGSSLEDEVFKYGEMGMLLHVAAGALLLLHVLYLCYMTALMGSSLEDEVFKYGEMGMLLHVAADRSNLELGVLNLETLERQEPPPGFWEDVLEGIQLRPDQEATLCLGFQQYVTKSTPLIQQMQDLVKRMQQLTGAPEAQGTAAQELALPVQQVVQAMLVDEPAAAAAVGAAASAGAAAGGQQRQKTQPPQQQQQQQSSMPSPPQRQQQQQCSRDVSEPVRLAGKCDIQGSASTKCDIQGSANTTKCDIQGSANTTNGRTPSSSVGPACLPPACGGSASSGSSSGSSTQQQQQQQQAWNEPTSTLQTMESSTELEDIMGQLLNRVMKLREMHRTVTFLWLNTLDPKQNAVSVVRSWPYWSRPLSMTSILARNKGVECEA